MIQELIYLANELDKKGLHKEADYLDSLIKKKAIGPALGLLALVICGSVGCVKVEGGDAEKFLSDADIDFDFVYDDEDRVIDVVPVGRMSGNVEVVQNHPTFSSPNITLIYPCDNYKVQRDTEFSKHVLGVGREGQLEAMLSWGKNEDGIIDKPEFCNVYFTSC